jgi:cAMP-dependent protein kinase regulator
VFYLIISREVYATKVFYAGETSKEVKQYKAGDYFGELALLKNGKREACVIART